MEKWNCHLSIVSESRFLYMEDFEEFDNFVDDNEEAGVTKLEDLVEPDYEMEFPGYTEYTEKFKLFGRQVYSVTKTNKKYWDHWEVHIPIPSIVIFYIISSYFFVVTLVFPLFDNFPILRCAGYTVLFALYLLSYIKIIIDGPGYFPFSYPKEIPNSTPTQSEKSPAGVVSDPLQYQLAKKQSGPNRCVFSSTLGRYVIRPDHYCTYAASWIGKRNHKYCFLFTMWGTIYIGLFIILAFYGILASPEQASTFIILFIYAMASVFIFVLSAYRAFITLKSIITNYTSWERWNDVDPNQYNKGLKYNLQDVFGTGNVLTWLLPISPFSDMNNKELIKNYDEYNIIDVHLRRKRRRQREREKRKELKEQQRREKALKRLHEIREQQLKN